jgi:hypothetical protein
LAFELRILRPLEPDAWSLTPFAEFPLTLACPTDNFDIHSVPDDMPVPSPVAIVEFSHSHLDCARAQVLFLKRAGIPVHLVLPASSAGQISHHEPPDHLYLLPTAPGFRGHWTKVLALREYVRSQGIRTVVFNTAEGNDVRDYCLIASADVLHAGTLHHTNKLRGSFTQRLISRKVRRYFVLMDFLLEGLPHVDGLRFSSFIPLFDPVCASPPLIKPDNEFWVCVPGEFEYRRRDYLGLAEELRTKELDKSIRLIFLGSAGNRDGENFRTLLAGSKHAAQCTLFADHVPGPLFDNYLRLADLFLPLLHPSTPIYQNYRQFQTSGTFFLAYSAGTPMLCDDSWQEIPLFQQTALFYPLGRLVERLNALARDNSPLLAQRTAIRSHPGLTFAAQQDRFLRLLNIDERQ